LYELAKFSFPTSALLSCLAALCYLARRQVFLVANMEMA